MSGASEPEEGREGGREAPSSSSAPFLPVGVDPVPNGEAGRQAEEEGEVPATTVDIRNANKRPRGKGGREECSASDSEPRQGIASV